LGVLIKHICLCTGPKKGLHLLLDAWKVFWKKTRYRSVGNRCEAKDSNDGVAFLGNTKWRVAVLFSRQSVICFQHCHEGFDLVWLRPTLW
jgi:hypothetical protein